MIRFILACFVFLGCSGDGYSDWGDGGLFEDAGDSGEFESDSSDTSSGDGDSDGDADTGQAEAWEDPDTGYSWVKDPYWDLPLLSQGDAVAYCEELDLDGFTDWTLPTIYELRSLVVDCPDTELGGTCQVNDTCLESYCIYGCHGCEAGGCYQPDLFLGCDAIAYWSSSLIANAEGEGWILNFQDGNVAGQWHTFNLRVRCVRSNQSI